MAPLTSLSYQLFGLCFRFCFPFYLIKCFSNFILKITFRSSYVHSLSCCLKTIILILLYTPCIWAPPSFGLPPCSCACCSGRNASNLFLILLWSLSQLFVPSSPTYILTDLCHTTCEMWGRSLFLSVSCLVPPLLSCHVLLAN